MAIFNSLKQSLTRSVRDTVSGVGDRLESAFSDIVSDAGFGRLLRGGPSSEPTFSTFTTATVSGLDKDWRVRLGLPGSINEGKLMAPIIRTGGLVFPYTPTILIQHTANYNALQPVHSNYPYYNYQNSQIEDMVITGDFFVENAVDAQYWIAMVQYLRAVTKMSYGESPIPGSPPPIVRLNGYGEFVFPNVPVVVRNFTVDLPADVDYIKTQVEGEITEDTIGQYSGKVGWVPTQSQVAVTVAPIYSRSKTAQFDLKKFVNGDYLGSGRDGGGFI